MGQAVFKRIQFLCNYFECKLAGQPGARNAAGFPLQQSVTTPEHPRNNPHERMNMLWTYVSHR